jgi:hypothetical protein
MGTVKINKESFEDHLRYIEFINKWDLTKMDLTEFTDKPIPKRDTEDWKHIGYSNFEYIKTLL